MSPKAKSEMFCSYLLGRMIQETEGSQRKDLCQCWWCSWCGFHSLLHRVPSTWDVSFVCFLFFLKKRFAGGKSLLQLQEAPWFYCPPACSICGARVSIQLIWIPLVLLNPRLWQFSPTGSPPLNCQSPQVPVLMNKQLFHWLKQTCTLKTPLWLGRGERKELWAVMQMGLLNKEYS